MFLGPNSITVFKNVYDERVNPRLVYMGDADDAPPAGQVGVHPGRWLHPDEPRKIGSRGAPGMFLAVSTSEKTNERTVAPRSVCVLVQRGVHTHLGIVASEERSLTGAPRGYGYPFYRWLFVLAIGEHEVTSVGLPGWFNAGSVYKSFRQSKLPEKVDYRQRVWRAFGLAEGMYDLPPSPTVPLTYPATYP